MSSARATRNAMDFRRLGVCARFPVLVTLGSFCAGMLKVGVSYRGRGVGFERASGGVIAAVRSDLEHRASRIQMGYRRAEGEFADTTLDRVSVDDVVGGLPVREFRWYKGRRHYSGWYWSSRTGRLVAWRAEIRSPGRRLHSARKRGQHLAACLPASHWASSARSPAWHHEDSARPASVLAG